MVYVSIGLLALAAITLAVAIRTRDAQSALLGVGILSLLLFLVSFGAGTAAVWTLVRTTLHEHKPVNVSDINQYGDSNPGLFVGGKDYAYFTAARAPAQGSPAQRHVFRFDPDNPCKVQEVAAVAGPDLVAILELPGNGELIAAHSHSILLKTEAGWQSVQDLGTATLQAAMADETKAMVLTKQEGSSEVSLHTLERTGAMTVHMQPAATAAVPIPVGGSLRLSQAENAKAAFLGGSNELGVLVVWNGQAATCTVSQPRPNLRHLSSGKNGFLVVHGAPGATTASLAAPDLADISFVASDGAETATIDDVFGTTQWMGDTWCLALASSKIGLYRLQGLKFVFKAEVKVPNQSPRSLCNLDSELGLLTGLNKCWNIDIQGKVYSAASSEVDPNFEVAAFWAFRGQALFAAKVHATGACAGGGSVAAAYGVELCRWWAD